MKPVITITLLLIILSVAIILCFAVLGMISYGDAVDFGIKSTATILILGVASAIISLLTKK